MEISKAQQESTMTNKPQKEHQWLQKLVGEWTFEDNTIIEPDKPSVKSEGTERVRSIGDFWILAEGHGEMPSGGAATMIMTLGYDPQKKRYVGTWIGSMMAYLWVYEGTLDTAERVLTLDSEGPSMVLEGKMEKYRDVIEFKNDDHRVLRSFILGNDGKWHEYMVTNYQRKK